MKKILSFIIFGVITLSLVSCDLLGTNLPKVKDEDKVTEVTLKDVEDFYNRLVASENLNDTFKLDLDLELEVYNKEEYKNFEDTVTSTYVNDNKFKGKGSVSYDLKGNINANVNISKFSTYSSVERKDEEKEVNEQSGKVKINYYSISNDKNHYLDLDLELTKGNTTVTTKGKHYEENSIIGNLPMLPDLEDFTAPDFSELLELLELEDVNAFLTENKDLFSLYVGEDYTALEVNLNKDGLFKFVTDEMLADAEIKKSDIKAFDISYVIKITDNKYEVGTKVNVNITSENTKVLVKGSISASTNKSAIKFPNFDAYTKKDFESLFDF